MEDKVGTGDLDIGRYQHHVFFLFPLLFGFWYIPSHMLYVIILSGCKTVSSSSPMRTNKKATAAAVSMVGSLVLTLHTALRHTIHGGRGEGKQTHIPEATLVSVDGFFSLIFL